jgi:serine/threonine-protein kinase
VIVKMKKKIFYNVFLMAIIAAVIVISGCTKGTVSTTETTNFLTYDNPADGVRIKYPNDWTKNSQATGAIVAFSSPQPNASNPPSAALGVTTEDLSTQPMTLAEYSELSIGNLKQSIPNAEILDSSETTLDGNSAHKIVYTVTQGQSTFEFMQIWTIKDNTAYIISYVADINKYNDFLDTAQEMINSFEIL